MEQSFTNYIHDNQLFPFNSKILVTVSGGVDSVVLCHLFYQLNIKFGIAHCNFQLRSEESEEDANFVSALSKKYDVSYHTIRFNTQDFAEKNRISIQMAARELRYAWFNKIKKDNQYDFIAIGHNKNDVIETFFINLARGTGIKGLTGIKAKTETIVRPILFALRNEISEYAKNQNLQFREDSSNASLKYHRNKIRHAILPVLKEINPNVENKILNSINYLNQVDTIYSAAIKKIKKSIIIKKDNQIFISIKELEKHNSTQAILFEILKEYQFNSQTIFQVSESLFNDPGSVFYSNTHELLKDRNYLIIKLIESHKNQEEYFITETDKIITKPVNIEIEYKKFDSNTLISGNNNEASIDYDKIIFPLKIRNWNSGDKFYPLGMNNSKKLSDFFIDTKTSLFEKKNIWIIENGNHEIIWIMGLRLDNRYKITKNTSKILILKMDNS